VAAVVGEVIVKNRFKGSLGENDQSNDAAATIEEEYTSVASNRLWRTIII
jgi:hypothetical protein